MQGFHKSIALAAGAAGILLLAGVPAHAEQDIQAELASKTAKHAELTRKAAELGSEVDGLRAKLVSTSKNLRNTEDLVSATDEKLKDLHDKKSVYIDKLYKNQDTYGGLVNAAQKYNSASMPDILAQSTPLDAARASMVMKSLLPALGQQSDQLKARLAEIDKIEADIKIQQIKKSKELNKLNAQQDDLSKLLEDRKTLYQQTEADRREQEAAMKKLALEARNLEDLVDRIQTQKKVVSSFRLPPGSLAPVSGSIRTGFGEKDDLGARSKGITFNTRSSASVVTPLAGKVKFAGPFQTYKQILIIEHQGGYHSLIAGLGRIDTVVGATLAAGEPVGTAENAPSGGRIYYELRQNGEPVNPQRMLSAQRKQDKS